MAATHPQKTILVVGPGPRKASGTDQFAHGAVSACRAFAAAGHKVVLLDNAPYLALPAGEVDIQRRVEPLTPAVLNQVAREYGVDWIYADAGGSGAQRLARAAEKGEIIGSGPRITAAALDRGSLFAHLKAAGLPTPPHAFVDSVATAVEAAQEMDFPLQVAVTTLGGQSLDDADCPTAGERLHESARADTKTAAPPALLYNLSDLEEWAEQQLEIRPQAALLLERAQLDWLRFEAVVMQDGEGHQTMAGLQAYLTPTGTPAAESGWVQPTHATDAQLLAALTQTSFELLKETDLKGIASLTLAVAPDAKAVIVTDLTLGTSRNVAFAAVAGGRPLYEAAARIASGAELAAVFPAGDETASLVAVRLPKWTHRGEGTTNPPQEGSRRALGDIIGLGASFAAALRHAVAAAGERSASVFFEAHPPHPWVAEALSEDASAGVAHDDASGPILRVATVDRWGDAVFHWVPLTSTQSAGGGGEKRRILVIAGQPNTIGQSRELDMAAAHAIAALKSTGCEVMVLACDPLSAVVHGYEEVQVCLGPATPAVISAIHRHHSLDGVLLQCAPGDLQTLAAGLANREIDLLGISSRALTLLASPMALHERLTTLGIPHPRCALASDNESALTSAEAIGYPLLLRPLTPSGNAPHLSGGNTALIMNAEMLTATLQTAGFADGSFLLEEFIEYAIEVTADALCDGVEAAIPQVVEHVELAGIHPGDSAWVIPPYSTPLRHVDTISEYLHKIALEFDLKGFLSGRFAIFNDTVYLLSVDLAFTRTAAMVSDSCGLPIFGAATRVMLGESLEAVRLPPRRLEGFSVREAVFPVSAEAKLASRMGPVMQSTGEVIGRAASYGMAYYKAQEAAGDRLPTSGTVLITVTDADKPSIIEPARLYREMGFRILTTRGTAAFLENNGIATETVRKLGMGRPDLVDAIKTRQVDLVINTPSGRQGQMDDGYIRKAAIRYNIPYTSTPAGALAAAKGISARRREAERRNSARK